MTWLETLVWLGKVLLMLLPVGVWCAWWLGGVNWHKCWPVLAKGAWAPVLLLAAVVAMVWARLQPGDCGCLGFVTIPNGWWQGGTVICLVLLALFCGWLQGYFGWAPEEIPLEPPAHAHDDHHQHAHAHH
jgi:hypothetical protein